MRCPSRARLVLIPNWERSREIIGAASIASSLEQADQDTGPLLGLPRGQLIIEIPDDAVSRLFRAPSSFTQLPQRRAKNDHLGEREALEIKHVSARKWRPELNRRTPTRTAQCSFAAAMSLRTPSSVLNLGC